MRTTKSSTNKPRSAASPARKAASTRRHAASDSGPAHRGNRKAVVRESPIHGRGVVARIPLASGERVCEYVGQLIDWPEALRRHPHNPEEPFHTFYFSVDDDWVIDANVDGNFARFINHSCEPNCEADMVEKDGNTRIFIQALRDIAPGEELVYNYGLTLEERYTPTLKKQFECRCGSPKCRGTMLSPKR